MKSVVFSSRSSFHAHWHPVLVAHGEVVLAALGEALPEDAGLAVLDLGSPDAEDVQPERYRGDDRRCRVLVAGRAFPLEQELKLLAHGVAACCPDGLSAESVERILSVVLNGGVWLSGEATPVVIGKLRDMSARQMSASRAPAKQGDGTLSPRELEVARLVAEGAPNKSIAQALQITDRTVKAHLTAIFAKLGVSDRLQLALWMTGQHQDR